MDHVNRARGRAEMAARQPEGHCRLWKLSWGLIGLMWPADRVVLGRRVCRSLRQELASHAAAVLLIRSEKAEVQEEQLVEDFRRLRGSKVSITWEIGSQKAGACPEILFNAIGSCDFGPSVRGLSLRRCNLSRNIDKLVGVLGNCTALAQLNLEHNKLRSSQLDRIVEVVSSCRSLSVLSVGYTMLRTHGADRIGAALENWPSLKALTLSNNSIGQSVGPLATGVASCTALLELDLSCNRFGDRGLELLMDGLRHCTNLEELCMCKTRIGAEGMAIAARVLPRLSHLALLDISDNSGIGDEGLTALATCLPECAQLRVLSLDDVGVGPDGAGRLAGVLGECSLLTDLTMGFNDKLSDEGVSRLAWGLPHCVKLAHLMLNNVGLANRGVTNLANVLSRIGALSCLDLGGNHFDADGVDALAGVLAGCSQLAELHLASNVMGDRGMTTLADALERCEQLKTLDLEDSGVTVEGFCEIGRALGRCTALTSLNLSGNESVGRDGIVGLARGLPHCKSLTLLEMAFMEMGDEGLSALAGALAACKPLERLDLTYNFIGDAGAARLAEVLGGCERLQEVVLRSNTISEAAAERLRGHRAEVVLGDGVAGVVDADDDAMEAMGGMQAMPIPFPGAMMQAAMAPHLVFGGGSDDEDWSEDGSEGSEDDGQGLVDGDEEEGEE